ncbi:MAG: hypothetical protein IJ453_00820 [Oscillospiraceae bacterium]|nr:hypothetical protein [Oscillospiraceae bacterium]
MIIHKMRASFGKLKGSLELKEGYNELYLPNEAGKSTWSAFLVAMLYGIDTSERANAQNQGLPAKERYRPWDGSAREGSVELEWNGKRITIERSTQGRIPMGKFSAHETHSGIPVPELTGENCGRILCGVERSVFERSAFIRQLGLAVSKDAALEKRMSALVTTGEEEGKSYSELEKELKSRRTKLIGRSGRISRATDRLEDLEQRLKDMQHLQEEALTLQAQAEEQVHRQQGAQAQLDRLYAARKAQKRAALLELESKLAQQEALCEALEDAAKTLPSEEALHGLQRQLEQRENALHTAQMDAVFLSEEIQKPTPPQGFENCDGESISEQARRDTEEVQRLLAAKPLIPILPTFLFALCVVAGLVLQSFSGILGFCLLGLGFLGMVVFLVLHLRSNAAVKAGKKRAQMILDRYGVTDPLMIQPQGWVYAAQLKQYHARSAEMEATRTQLLAAEQQAREELAELLLQVRSFAPTCVSADDCRRAVAEGLQTHEKLQSQRRLTDYLRQQHQAMQPLLEKLPDAEADPEALAFDEAKLLYEKRSAVGKSEELRSRLERIHGALSAMGDLISMEAEAEQLREQIDRDTVQLEVIDMAMAALQEADSALRSRFSPRITAEAGKILGTLTGEKYATLRLDPELQLSVRESEAAIMRPAAAMSCGTADQMYLALRLAMSHQLLPGDVPLILDDALVNFDETRAEAAIKLLKAEAETRQVILFTCRKF